MSKTVYIPHTTWHPQPEDLKVYTEEQLDRTIEQIKGQMLVRIHDIEKQQYDVLAELRIMRYATFLFALVLIWLLWPIMLDTFQ